MDWHTEMTDIKSDYMSVIMKYVFCKFLCIWRLNSTQILTISTVRLFAQNANANVHFLNTHYCRDVQRDVEVCYVEWALGLSKRKGLWGVKSWLITCRVRFLKVKTHTFCQPHPISTCKCYNTKCCSAKCCCWQSKRYVSDMRKKKCWASSWFAWKGKRQRDRSWISVDQSKYD